jgi:hypothetical protein
MRAGRTPTAIAIALTAWSLTPAWAQPADNTQRPDLTASDDRNDADLARNKASDLLIKTQDASGTLGAALPLAIKLVRVRNVYIEAIKLLGLPRGVTISDSDNTFSSTSDNNDVDVSAWDLSKIQITQDDPRESSFSLAVAAIWTPESGGHIDVTSSRLSVRFTPDHRDRVAAAGDDGPSVRDQPAAPARDDGPPPRIVAGLDAPAAGSTLPEPAPSPVAPPESTAALARPAPSEGGIKAASLPQQAEPARPLTGTDPLVERAKGLIRLGDISGARLLLERAQARNAPNATFLLAQTWDPERLRSWKVRGLRSDADLARSLYARAAEQGRADERRLAATGR